MRRAALFIPLVLAVTATVVSPAEATSYRGGGEGIRVIFRVEAGKIVFAKVGVTLFCIDRTHDRKRQRHLGAVWGTDRLLPGVTEFHTDPITLRGARFAETSGDDAEAGYASKEIFAGKVRYGAVAGGFLYVNEYRTSARQERCQTGGYPGEGERGFVRFSADRR